MKIKCFLISKRWNLLNQFSEECSEVRKNKFNTIIIVFDTVLIIGQPNRNLYDLEEAWS